MKKIIRKIINSLKTFKEVETIGFGGSYAKGVQDKHSDVDIYVFYKNKITDEKIRKKTFQNLARFDKTYITDKIDFFFYDGLMIHTWWVDIKKLDKDITKDDVKSKSIVLYSKVLWDRKGYMKKLRKKSKFPLSLTKKICLEEGNLSAIPAIFRDTALKSFDRRRLFFIEDVINKQTENMIKVIYALNRRYYPDYPQYIEFDFRDFISVPKDALNNINKIGRYSLFENPKEKLTAIYELYWGIVDLIEKKWKFPHASELFSGYGDREWFKRRIDEISEEIKNKKKGF